jgi:hypothetical protein
VRPGSRCIVAEPFQLDVQLASPDELEDAPKLIIDER